MSNSETSPIQRLLELGPKAFEHWGTPWFDYLSLGLADEHASELIGILSDPSRLLLDWDRQPAASAPYHALRALVQLKSREGFPAAMEAVALLERETGDLSEGTMEDLERYAVAVPETAMPLLGQILGDPARSESLRHYAADYLRKIAMEHPAHRGGCAALLRETLARTAGEKDPTLNGFLVNALCDAGTAEDMPLLEPLFRENLVDETVVSWEDVRAAFGLPPAPHPAGSRRARTSLQELREKILQAEMMQGAAEVLLGKPLPDTLGSLRQPRKGKGAPQKQTPEKPAKRHRKRHR